MSLGHAKSVIDHLVPKIKNFETESQILNAENEKELIEKFQNKIPIVNYEDIKEFVEKEKKYQREHITFCLNHALLI